MDARDDKHTHLRPTPVSHEHPHLPRSNPEFPAVARAIGDATAEVLAELAEVTAMQRESILAMLEIGGPAPEVATEDQLEAQVRPVQHIVDSSHATHPSAGELLAHAAAQAIAQAMHNTVAASQQLDIVAQAILVRIAQQRLEG
jgi:hypothetical protein